MRSTMRSWTTSGDSTLLWGVIGVKGVIAGRARSGVKDDGSIKNKNSVIFIYTMCLDKNAALYAAIVFNS